MPRLIALFATLLLIAGCGDDGGQDEDTSAGETIAVDSSSRSKAQFIRRADTICRRRREGVEAQFAAFVKQNGGLASSRSELGLAAERVVEEIYLPAGATQIDRIKSLGVPAGDEATVATILEAIQNGLEEAGNHPVRFVRALSAEYAPFAEAERLAAAYGFKECGKG
jgi:hypothetical protein